MENKKNCLDCHYCLECDGIFICADTGFEVKENEFCPNFVNAKSVEYAIYLTKQEIEKTINLIEVVVQPLRKVVKKSKIPKQKREAQEALAEVDGLLNKFKIYKENEENDSKS